jgi:hypothetical protein
MQLSPASFIVLFIALDLLPALLIAMRMEDRARSAGVSSKPHFGIAIVGGLLAGMAGNGAGAWYWLHRMWKLDPLPNAWLTPLVIGSGILGSVAVAGLVYLRHRMAAQRDPDYGPLDPPPNEPPAARREG